MLQKSVHDITRRVQVRHQALVLALLLSQSLVSPASSYELIIRQYTYVSSIGETIQKEREKILREVGKSLQDKGVTENAVISVTLDFDGTVRNLKFISGPDSDRERIANIQIENNFGALPGCTPPASMTFQFRMNELSQNPFEASKTEFLQTKKIPDFAIAPKDDSNPTSIGSWSITHSDSNAQARKTAKQIAYSKSDELYDTEMLTAMLQSQSGLNYNTYVKGKDAESNTSYLLAQATKLENSRQYDSAGYVYAAAGLNFYMIKDRVRASESLAECLRISSKCSDCNKLVLAVKLFSMRQRQFPVAGAFTDFEDTAMKLLNSFSSKNHKIEIGRITLLKNNSREKKDKKIDAKFDEQILKLTQQISEEQLHPDVVEAYAQLQRCYTQMKDYAKAKESADEEIAQSLKKSGHEILAIIPALCTQLNFYITKSDLTNIKSVLKRIETASQICSFEARQPNHYAQVTRYAHSSGFTESMFLAKQTLSDASYKSIEEQLKKLAFRLEPSVDQYSNQKFIDLTSCLTAAGKAEEALALLDEGILVQKCLPANRDTKLQIRELEIVEQSTYLPNRDKRLQELKNEREESLRIEIAAVSQVGPSDKTPQLLNAYVALIKYLLEEKKAEEAQKQFNELAGMLGNAPTSAGIIKPYYATLLSFLKPVKDQPSLDPKVVLATIKSVLKKDNYISPSEALIPHSKSDSNDYGEEAMLIFLEDAIAKLGTTAPSMIPIFKNAASYYGSIDNFDSAINYDKKVLHIQQQTATNKIDIEHTKTTLASHYAGLGQLNEADAMTRELLQAPEDTTGNLTRPLVFDLCSQWLAKNEIERAADLLKASNKANISNPRISPIRYAESQSGLVLGSTTRFYDMLNLIIEAFEKRKEFDQAIGLIEDTLKDGGAYTEDDQRLMHFDSARLYLDKCAPLLRDSEDRKVCLSKSNIAFDDAVKATDGTPNLKTDWLSNWFANKRVGQLKQLGESKAADDLQKQL